MNNPYYLRPRKWDNVLQKWRYLFWSEISDTQRMLELEYSCKQSIEIIESITGDNNGKGNTHRLP